MRASMPLRLLLLPFLCVVLATCATVPPAATDAVVRSAHDSREYRYLELPNRMRVLLVSDPQTDKAAASLLVRAGSGNDPAHRQGLAHFLEHMLFLGTRKYPDPGEYMEFINAHGGSNNAYTGIDRTNYFFSVEPASLAPALDRFAQFFVAPLFDPAYVEREANAVDSEYRLGLKDDGRREYDVLRELVRPDHPLAKLGVGNLQTLDVARGGLRADLLAFHERYYSAALMTLVVLGRESLDELQSLVAEDFGVVADHGRSELHDVPSMFAPGTLPLEVRIRPEKELRELTLLFPMPSARARYAAKPLEYIGNLLGHEGPGSVLSALKARGWAESLSAGAGLDLYGEDAFQISLQLTAQGVAHYREITALVLHAVQTVRGGVDEWRFREQADLAALGFRFREKGSPTSAAIGLAESLQKYPVSDALRGPYVYSDFDPALIARYLGYLRADNLLLTLSHRDVATDRSSRWFETPYGVSRLDANELAREAAAVTVPLVLPGPNEFVPHNVELKQVVAAQQRPQLLVDSASLRLWHLQDASFGVPKASIVLQLLSPVPGRSARDAALAVLHARLVNDALNEYAYPATLAGLDYAVEPDARGLTVRIGGYDDRQSVLLGKVLATLQRERFAPERLAAIRTELLRQWSNSARRPPYQQLVDEMHSSLVAGNYRDAELRAALEQTGPEDLARFVAELRGALTLEMLVHGNYSPDEARALAELARTALGSPPPAVVPPVEVVALKRGSLAREIKVDHPDSALLLYVQGADSSDEERARVALDAQILGAAFFNELRTEKQLGYVTFAQNYPLYRVPGVVFAVQSPVAAPRGLAAAFEEFLAGQRKTANELDEATFARHRQSLAERLREKPKSLAEASQRLWAEITIGALDFGDRERIAAAVEHVSREEWEQHFSAQIAVPDRRGVWFWSEGSAHPDANDAPPAGTMARSNWPAGSAMYRFERR
jgi:insulysin